MNNKNYIIIFSVITVLSLAISAVALLTRRGEEPTVNLTVVQAPAQTEAEWPPTIFNPLSLIIALPDTPNLALERPVTASSFTDIYVPANAVDGSATSYWESHGFPAEFTIELDGTHNVSTVAVALNPSLLWEARSQAFEILVSSDGNSFTSIVANEMHAFDPTTGNTVRVDFAPVQARYVRLVFTVNSAVRTMGAQAAEIMVFGS
ncbi:MAG: discoidin domain-containing protein [Defluviitaleaceae bacterium]|nr:discoidin domain-containing protein [Defluviitaleaceae bacterium]